MADHVQAMLHNAVTPREDGVPVFDPRIPRFGVLWVDEGEVEPTRGLERRSAALQGECRPLSVCHLHQRKRCNMEVRCNQIHVSAAYMGTLTRALLARGDCCNHHGISPVFDPALRAALDALVDSGIPMVVRFADRTWVPIPHPAWLFF